MNLSRLSYVQVLAAKMNKKIKLGGIVLFLLLLIIASIISPVTAESPSTITVNDSSAIVDFPLALNFSARINSNVNMIDVRLRYKIDQMSFADVTNEVFIVFHEDDKEELSVKLKSEQILKSEPEIKE